MIDRLRRIIQRRRHAYRELFKPQGATSIAAGVVLADLRQFCRATTSTTIVSPITRAVDPIASAQAEGRREVFLRIAQMIHIDDADLYKLVERDDDEGHS